MSTATQHAGTIGVVGQVFRKDDGKHIIQGWSITEWDTNTPWINDSAQQFFGWDIRTLEVLSDLTHAAKGLSQAQKENIARLILEA